MKREIPERIQTILDEVKKCLENIYGNKLKGLILYGSYARGDFSEGSDIDIILLLEDIKDPIEEREKYFDVIWQLNLKYDTVISITPFNEEEYIYRFYHMC